ncbi:(4Fe-4S)-binding protein [Mycolicibacterium hippocampi]|nr:(4Fe-4S)-binding protein [Mycolicibacterium hippocampi]
MRIAGDREICMAAGVCVMTADVVFDQDEDGIVVLLAEQVPHQSENIARNAVRMCPSGALQILAD